MEKAIKFYHSMHLTQEEILELLAYNQNIILSRRTLQRKLKSLDLYRRKSKSDPNEVAEFIRKQLLTSGRDHGYKWMHVKCLNEGFVIDQRTVYYILLLLDPHGVKQRKKRRLNRRSYCNRGPNFTWHIDSNDKLKPYGIFINGCSDGFSRLVVWLRARGDGKARGTANHFINAVKCRNGCPQVVRSDMGVENATVIRIQKFLRRNHNDSRSGDNSVICGDSRRNQRIEFWWSILRKEGLQFWMDLFKHLGDDGYFTGDFLDKNLIRFCFLEIIQDELDNVVSVWNIHQIRKSSKTELPCGKPVILYSLPHIYGYEDKLLSVDSTEVEVCEDEVEIDNTMPCNTDVYDLCEILMEENSLEKATDPYDAVNLYQILRTMIRQLI